MEERTRGAAFVDLRPVPLYLEGHIPASLALHYEDGPGTAARARDCLPLDVPLVLLGFHHGDLDHAAAALRGKGFTVLGVVADPMRDWVAAYGRPATTEILTGPNVPDGVVALNVGDPAAVLAPNARSIPVELLWPHAREVATHDRIAVVAGAGVRAALAVGILERAGARDVALWRRPRGRPAEAR